MIKERHPMVAELFVRSLEGVPDTPYLRGGSGGSEESPRSYGFRATFVA